MQMNVFVYYQKASKLFEFLQHSCFLSEYLGKTFLCPQLVAAQSQLTDPLLKSKAGGALVFGVSERNHV